MTELPKVLATSTTERFGVNHVERQVIKSGCMWRELTMHDVGIDGHIEYVHEGLATGHSVAVQIKTGTSYLKDGLTGFFEFAPTAKHRSYWERSAYPVILVLVDPDAETAYWADARAAVRDGKTKVLVPKARVLDPAGVLACLRQAGPLPRGPLEYPDVAAGLIGRSSGNASFPVDFFDLFVHGLVDRCMKVYFDVGLAHMIAESTLAADGTGLGIGVGPQEHEFLYQYVAYLAERDLARVDFDAYQRDWNDGLQGRFLAPLTQRGLGLVTYLSIQEGEGEGIRAIQDKFFQGITEFEVPRRIDAARRLKERLVH
jgi:hypothetical protein